MVLVVASKPSRLIETTLNLLHCCSLSVEAENGDRKAVMQEYYEARRRCLQALDRSGQQPIMEVRGDAMRPVWALEMAIELIAISLGACLSS